MMAKKKTAKKTTGRTAKTSRKKPATKSAKALWVPINKLDCCQIVALIAYFRVRHCCCCSDTKLSSEKWMCKQLRKELKGVNVETKLLDALKSFESNMATRLSEKACMRLHPQLAGMISQYASGCCAESGSKKATPPPAPPPPPGKGGDPDDDVWPPDSGTLGGG